MYNLPLIYDLRAQSWSKNIRDILFYEDNYSISK